MVRWITEDLLFKEMHEYGRKRGGKFSAHGCAVCLQVIGVVELKVVMFKDIDHHSLKYRGGGTSRVRVLVEHVEGCCYSFVLGDVGVEGFNVYSYKECSRGERWKGEDSLEEVGGIFNVRGDSGRERL